MPYITAPGHPKRLPLEIGLTLMAIKGSAPQIIKLLDWQEETGHYIMVMEQPFPCMDLLRFIKIHGGNNRREHGTTHHSAGGSCRQRLLHKKLLSSRAQVHSQVPRKANDSVVARDPPV
ncbi:hypothetical protein QQF64_008447 [Cirrhinus molitorella]|uniref:non-specific serine/threonine protein kinase n=1 Tax=Cirrhinus molitorella TaxID=172907 RepID=A0ABR3M7K9_9TELE